MGHLPNTFCFISPSSCFISPSNLLHFPNKSLRFPNSLLHFPNRSLHFPNTVSHFPNTFCVTLPNIKGQRKVKARMGRTMLHCLLPRHHRCQRLLLHPHLSLLNHYQLLDQNPLVALTTTVSPIWTAIEGAYFLCYDIL